MIAFSGIAIWWSLRFCCWWCGLAAHLVACSGGCFFAPALSFAKFFSKFAKRFCEKRKCEIKRNLRGDSAKFVERSDFAQFRLEISRKFREITLKFPESFAEFMERSDFAKFLQKFRKTFAKFREIRPQISRISREISQRNLGASRAKLCTRVRFAVVL